MQSSFSCRLVVSIARTLRLLLAFAWLLTGAAVATAPLAGAEVPDVGRWLQPVPATAIFSDPNYEIWCGSVVESADGKFHLFYSRWPRRYGHGGWINQSEIARAVSDSPLGPFRHVEVVLPARGDAYWDGACTHNPTVLRIGSKFYLYYMGNTRSPDPAERKNGYWMHRNRQRIGVAVADRPEGPWTRFDQPVLDVSPEPDAPDSLCVTNPTATVRPEGGVMMIYKGVGRHKPLPFGGPVVLLVATADSPLGPFTKHPQTVVGRSSSAFAAEDPFVWHDGERYLAIVKDMGRSFSKTSGYSLALLTSPDGLSEWVPAPHPFVTGLILPLADGGQLSLKRLERPQILFRGGRPIALYCAAFEEGPNGRGSFNIGIPLQP